MKFTANYLVNTLRILGAVLALLSMVALHPVYAGWRKAPTDKQQINMQVPGMEHWNPGYWKAVDDSSYGNVGTAYHTKWRLIDEFGVHAQLSYQARERQFYYVTVRDLVNITLGKGYTPSFEEETNSYLSNNRKFEYVYFSVTAGSQERRCAGFLYLSSSRKNAIYGHYCLSRDEPIDDEIVTRLIDSIDLGTGPD